MSTGPGRGVDPPAARNNGSAGRAGDFFPVPKMLDQDTLVESFGGRRQAQRLMRDANECVRSLNWLAGCSRRPSRSSTTSAGHSKCQFLQEDVQSRVLQAVVDRGLPVAAPTPKEAFMGLLRGRGIYDVETAYANLATFKPGAVSLPASVQHAPQLQDILPSRAREYLEGMEQLMLRETEKVREEREAGRTAKIYTDKFL